MIFLFILPAILIAYIYKLIKGKPTSDIKGKHAVITGGSSGIGKAVAKLLAEKGANVTIIARNMDNLNKAYEEIKNSSEKSQIITKLSVDVSDYDAVEKALDKVEREVGPIYMMVNCAGMAICHKTEEYSLDEIKKLIDVNYLGTLYTTKAVLPKMKAKKEGIIVMTGSGVSLMGMYGYSVYSSVKFALRGLAESVQMETKPYNISVTLSLPPDTDTPGFENENKTKPKETQLISQSAGLHDPSTVAAKLVQDALAGNFFSYIGFESWILATLCVGMSPFTSFCDVLIESFVIGPARLIGVYYLRQFDQIVKDCYDENVTKKVKPE